MSGVDHLIGVGIADPERLTIEGQSFGGYCVRAVITQTDRFKAAISTAGSSGNLINSYGSGFAQYRVTADLFQNRQAFIDNSPVFFYDRVKTPLLLQLGLNDVGYWGDRDTDWDVRVLKGLGAKVELLEYEGRGTSFLATPTWSTSGNERSIGLNDTAGNDRGDYRLLIASDLRS